MVGARSFQGNPYNGHTLAEQLKQTAIFQEDIGRKPRQVMVDLGFCGLNAVNPSVRSST